MADIRTLIKELQRYDNDGGYRISHSKMETLMADTLEAVVNAGEEAVEHLHPLLLPPETWSCYYAIKALTLIKSEKSIPFLINFIVENDDFEYSDAGEEAMRALTAIGQPAVEPLLDEIKAQFRKKEQYTYLVGALSCIEDERVFAFMRDTLEDYIQSPLKYRGWFDPVPFQFDIDKQGHKEESVTLLKRLIAMKGMHRMSIREFSDTIKKIEDPEGWERELEALRQGFKPVLDVPSDYEEGSNLEEIPKKQKVGRNEPCPCGSGKKYKKCCYKPKG